MRGAGPGSGPEWARASADDRALLLGALARAARRGAPGFCASAEGRSLLRTLPLFPTGVAGVPESSLGSAVQTFGHASLDRLGVAFVTAAPGPAALFVAAAASGAPDTLLLAPQPPGSAEAELFAALGVEELSDAAALARLVLPRLGGLDASGRAAAIAYMRKHWPRLRADAGLRAAVALAAFLTPCASDGSSPDPARLARACDLLDWRDPDLLLSSAGAALFPEPAWRRDGDAVGRQLLVDAGLRATMGPDGAVAAAERAAAAFASARGRADAAAAANDAGAASAAAADAAAAAAAAAALAAHVFAHASGNPHAALAALGRAAWAPALPAGTPGGPAVASLPGAPRLLVAPCESLLPSDWHLGWAVRPTLEAAPPAALLRALGVRSPPPWAVFCAHAHAAAGQDGGAALLARWPPLAGPPEDAFDAALSHAGRAWPDLAPAERSALAGARLVVTTGGSRLVAPSHIFLRASAAAPPLAAALPPRLLPLWHVVLRDLGGRDAPSPGDAARLLQDRMRRGGGAQPLAPDELRAAIALARLAAKATLLRDGDVGEGVPLPDAGCVLRPAPELACGAGEPGWRLRAATALAVAVAHPAAGTALCAALRARPLLDALAETVLGGEPDAGGAVEELRGCGETLRRAACAVRLAEPRFAAAAAAALSATGGAPLSPEDVGRTLREAAAALRFSADGLAVAVARAQPLSADVPLPSAAPSLPPLRVPFYVSPPPRCVLLVAPPPPWETPSEALSAALSAVLRAPVPLPLAPLLRAQGDAAMDAACAQLAARCAPAAGGPSPGAPLEPRHAAMLVHRPLAAFAEGDLVAVRAQPPSPAAGAVEADAAAAAGAADSQPPPSPLVYARVVADSRPVAGEPVFAVRCETAPGVARDLLSCDLLCFTAAPGDEGDAAGSMGGCDGGAAQQQPLPRPPVPAAAAAAGILSLLAGAGLVLDGDRAALVTPLLAAQAEAQAARRAADAASAAAASSGAVVDVLCRALACPITQSLLVDPVICADGHTYERAAITRWLTTSPTSPVTNARLANTVLIPNHVLRAALAALRERG